MKNLIFTVTLGLVSLSTYAAEIDSSNSSFLLQHCNSYLEKRDNDKTPTFDTGICYGHVRGVMETLELHRMFTGTSIFNYCAPDNANFTQTIRVIVKYLNDHPASLHSNATSTMIVALSEAFPCK